MPAMPVSVASITPLLLASDQMRPAMALLVWISPKLLAVETAPGVFNAMFEIALGTVVIGVALPPAVPATV